MVNNNDHNVVYYGFPIVLSIFVFYYKSNKRIGNYYFINISGFFVCLLFKKFKAINMPKIGALAHRIEKKTLFTK